MLIGEGLREAEIAAHLGISISTVKIHKQHVYQKLGVRNAVEMVLVLQKESTDVG